MNNYQSKYTGQDIDGAVEYFKGLNQISLDKKYSYSTTVYAKSSSQPPSPMPIGRVLPSFPFSGNGGIVWYRTPNSYDVNEQWWQCTIVIDNYTNTVTQVGVVLPLNGKDGKDGKEGQTSFAKYISVTGTCQNETGNYNPNAFISINGNDSEQVNSPGHTLYVINPQTGQVLKSQNFDTSGSDSENEIRGLCDAVDTLDSGLIFVLLSYQQCSCNTLLRHYLKDLWNSSDTTDTTWDVSKKSHVVIGIKLIEVTDSQTTNKTFCFEQYKDYESSYLTATYTNNSISIIGGWGQNGTNGEDGWTAYLTISPLVIKPSILSNVQTGECNVTFNQETSPRTQLISKHGTKEATVSISRVDGDAYSTASYNSSGQIWITSISQVSSTPIKINNQTTVKTTRLQSSGFVTVYATAIEGSSSYNISLILPWIVDDSDLNTVLFNLNNNGISSVVAKEYINKTDYGELENTVKTLNDSYTSLNQTVDNISAKVGNRVVRGINLLPDSYFRKSFSQYGACTRQVYLEANKNYVITVRYRIDPGLYVVKRFLNIFLYNDSPNEHFSKAWEYSNRIVEDFKSTTLVTQYPTQTITDSEGNQTVMAKTFNVPYTGQYSISAYPYPNQDYFPINCIYIEWIVIQEDTGVDAWSMSNTDSSIQGNLLPVLGKETWNNVTNIPGQKDIEGYTSNIVYYNTTASSDGISTQVLVDPKESFTLSFYAKGTGTITSQLQEACNLSIRDDGNLGTELNGDTSWQLTSEWKKYYVTWSITNLIPNVLLNASLISDGSSGIKDWDLITSELEINNWGRGAKWVTINKNGEYGQLSQDITNAIITETYYTLQFYSKNTSAFKVYIMGCVDKSQNIYLSGELQDDQDGLVVQFSAKEDWTQRYIMFKTLPSITNARIYIRTENTLSIVLPHLHPQAVLTQWQEADQYYKTLYPAKLTASSGVGEIYIAGIKFEKCGRPTAFTNKSVNTYDLLDTGIDIQHKKITVTSDQFEVQNNSGEVTASVNAEGNLQTKNIKCIGGTFEDINVSGTSTLNDVTVTGSKVWINQGTIGGKQEGNSIIGGFTFNSFPQQTSEGGIISIEKPDYGLTSNIPDDWVGMNVGQTGNITIQSQSTGNPSFPYLYRTQIGVVPSDIDPGHIHSIKIMQDCRKTSGDVTHNIAIDSYATGQSNGYNYSFYGVGHNINYGINQGIQMSYLMLDTDLSSTCGINTAGVQLDLATMGTNIYVENQSTDVRTVVLPSSAAFRDLFLADQQIYCVQLNIMTISPKEGVINLQGASTDLWQVYSSGNMTSTTPSRPLQPNGVNIVFLTYFPSNSPTKAATYRAIIFKG